MVDVRAVGERRSASDGAAGRERNSDAQTSVLAELAWQICVAQRESSQRLNSIFEQSYKRFGKRLGC
jgi:hypothetical protein